jgi:hypothetical protein
MIAHRLMRISLGVRTQSPWRTDMQIRLCILIGLPALLACSAGRSEAARPSTPIMECGWVQVAEAWADTDRNKLRGPSEKTLPNVRFEIVDRLLADRRVGRSARTDKQGRAELWVRMAGCPEVDLLVTAEAPEGYEATTPNPVAARELAEGDTLRFGFAPIF